jgi:competence protein ComEC
LSLLLAAATTWFLALSWGGEWVSGAWVLIALVLVTLRLLGGKKAMGMVLPSIVAMTLLVIRFIVGVSEQPESHYYSPFEFVRASAKSLLSGVTPDSMALTLGLAIGDDSLASQRLLSDMRATSMTHLTAVSGSNCAIVTGSVFLLFRKFSVRTRVFASLTSLLLYVLLVGLQPSVLRAATMATIVLLAYATGRRVKAIAALALSVSILIVADPKIAFEFGFALSVAATAGILWVAPAIYEKARRKVAKPIALSLSVSAAAQLLCFPILLQLQPGLPTYSLFANMLAEPLVAPVTLVSLLAISVSFLPALSTSLFWIASVFAWLITQIAHFFAGLPFETSAWPAGLLGTLMALLLVLAVIISLFSQAATTRLIATSAAAFLALGSAASLANGVVRVSTWPGANWQVASCDVGQGVSQIALIDVGNDETKIDSCLSRLGVSKIDLLVLTHFDQDHVGAIEAVLASRKADRVLISPFEDSRPAVKRAMSAVGYVGAEVVLAERGLSGHLGDVHWSVLSPERHAVGSEDSNDASISMLFEFAGFNLIAMADLGEKGQMRIASNIDFWYEPESKTEPLVLKVAHHGSADQYAELFEYLRPSVSLLSVGKANGYGHPTAKTLALLARTGSLICRTDELGSVTIGFANGEFVIANNGAS